MIVRLDLRDKVQRDNCLRRFIKSPEDKVLKGSLVKRKMVEKNITNLMKEEHKKIDSYLDDFKRKYEKRYLDIFWRNVKHHFVIEESAIFILAGKNVGRSREEILSLKKQHKEILREIKIISEDFPEKQRDLIKKLATLIVGHVKYEEKVFYPKIDQMLDPLQKEELVERIRKMIQN